MKVQWEGKLSELQAKHAHSLNMEKEQAMKVHTHHSFLLDTLSVSVNDWKDCHLCDCN